MNGGGGGGRGSHTESLKLNPEGQREKFTEGGEKNVNWELSLVSGKCCFPVSLEGGSSFAI